MSQENVEIVKASLDGWNRGDFDAWIAPSHSHPDIEWSSEVTMRMEGSETVFRGWDGLRRYVSEFEGSVARRVRSYLDPRRALEAVGLPE